MGELLNQATFGALDTSYGTALGFGAFVVIVLTVVQLVFRVMKVTLSEWVGERWVGFKNQTFATLVGMVATLFLVLTGTWVYLWQLFGAANQLMAALSLVVVTVWLTASRRNPAYAGVPALFMYVTTLAAIVVTAYNLYATVFAKNVGVAGKEIAVLGEMLAVSAMVMCLLFVTVDIGRPDRFWHLIPKFGILNFPQSLLAWDVVVLNTYLVLNLAPGPYVVTASKSGFQTVSLSLTLSVGQRARLDFALPIGAVGETVTVQAAPALLDTQTAVVGSVVSRNEVANLPLAIRNWDDLLFTLPGVQGDRYTEQTGTTNAGRTGGVSVHGNRSLQNNFLLDGVDNNSISENVQELTTQVSRPSVDAIGEFKVVTSAYSAEFGKSPGAAISVTTKSGTNTVRGTAYEFLRNDRFNSNDFFSIRQGSPKPDHKQNDFGGNLGGPIVRSRAFFFGDVEATRLTQGVTRLTVVPTANERNGVFAATVRDPLTGQPFPTNTIPADRIDPVARRADGAEGRLERGPVAPQVPEARPVLPLEGGAEAAPQVGHSGDVRARTVGAPDDPARVADRARGQPLGPVSIKGKGAIEIIRCEPYQP